MSSAYDSRESAGSSYTRDFIAGHMLKPCDAPHTSLNRTCVDDPLLTSVDAFDTLFLKAQTSPFEDDLSYLVLWRVYSPLSTNL